MNRKQNFFDKAAAFISGKGFYLVVLLCVAAIGVSGYFLMRSLTGAGEEAHAAAGTTQMPESTASPRPSAAVRPSLSPIESQSPAPTVSPQPSAQPSPEPEPSVSVKPAPLVFTWPVKGAVIASYSVETLLYDETMLDWRTHEGIDVASSLGTKVLAAAAGTVREVYDDELMGTTVVIDHGDGLASVYANLAAKPTVAAGDSVRTGDVIGSVGSTAAAESGRASHLHFAMYQNDLPVDPEDYLPD